MKIGTSEWSKSALAEKEAEGGRNFSKEIIYIYIFNLFGLVGTNTLGSELLKNT